MTESKTDPKTAFIMLDLWMRAVIEKWEKETGYSAFGNCPNTDLCGIPQESIADGSVSLKNSFFVDEPSLTFEMSWELVIDK